MEYVNVTTQQELDKALANGDFPICVGNGYFTVWDQSTVEASDQSIVRASGQSTVRASDQSTVRASGQSTVRASGQSTIRAWDQSTVEASDQSTVRASDQSTVRASGQSTVEASKYVAVHQNGDTPKINGGVLIKIPSLNDPNSFFDYYGIKITKGKTVVFKLVNDNFISDHGCNYTPKSEPTCVDWNDRNECGGGLHFSPHAFMARRYSRGTRFVACEIDVKDAVIITEGTFSDKLKAPSCKVLYECDEDGVKLP